MSLPSGVFELVAEYLPLPRVWQWSLVRLRRRCKLAPHQAVQDLCIIMDEILRDTGIFAGRDQTNLLMRLNRSPQVRVTLAVTQEWGVVAGTLYLTSAVGQAHAFLIEKMGMSEALLDTLCAYADAQGLLLRATEAEVTFKPHYARNMQAAACDLYRWHRNRSNAMKVLSLQPHQASSGNPA
jgi:hypothetical protein